MNKHIIFIIVFLFFLLISLNNASAINFELEVNKKDFILNDTIIIKAKVFNDKDKKQTITIESQIENNKNTYQVIIPTWDDIGPKTEKEIILYTIKVTPDIDSGVYSVRSSLSSKQGFIEEKQLSFSVDNLFEDLFFDVNFCKTKSCTKKSKIFILFEDIYLSYTSDTTIPLITAILTYPDKTKKQITLPISLKAEQLGTYTLEVTASKQGYKTITKKEQFAVIEKHAEIKIASKCNANGVCDPLETPDNCPQDCKKGISIKWMIISITIVLVIVTAVILYRKRKQIQT